MAIKQIIDYKGNNTYFAGFMNSLMTESEINGSITFDSKKITVLVSDTDSNKLENFISLTNKYLPHSIFLGDIETLVVSENIEPKEFNSMSYDIAPCSKCMEKLLDPSSETYLNDSLLCNHYSNNETKIYQDLNTFSPNYSDNSVLLLANPEKIDDLFIITENEKKVLFSIEKPTIKVTLKDENLKFITNKNFIFVKAAYNIKSALVAQNAKESGIDYLFFHDNSPSICVIVQKNISIIKDTKFSLSLENLNEDKRINRFLNIAKEAGYKKGSIGAYLSSIFGISFIISNENGSKIVLSEQKFNQEETINFMRSDDIKSKLLKNFENKFPAITQKINLKNNLNIYELICMILELDLLGFESLSDTASLFRGNGGLKIDIFFNENGIDYSSFLGSIISFKLAGTDKNYLAYSIMESFADMTISSLNQLKSKFKIDNFVMLGDMFQNSVLYSRILSKFQLSNPYFSNFIAFDE